MIEPEREQEQGCEKDDGTNKKISDCLQRILKAITDHERRAHGGEPCRMHRIAVAAHMIHAMGIRPPTTIEVTHAAVQLDVHCDDPCCKERKPLKPRPRVVCLIATRDFDIQQVGATYYESVAGKIVLDDSHRLSPNIPRSELARLDKLHLEKILLCDEVLVLGREGKLPASVRREIRYAKEHCKPVRYLEPRE